MPSLPIRGQRSYSLCSKFALIQFFMLSHPSLIREFFMHELFDQTLAYMESN